MPEGSVEIRDYVLWPKHLHGNALLREELLVPDTVVTLTVAGVTGTWVKMAEGKNGAATPALRALGSARTHWHGLFRIERGAVVPISRP